MMQVWSIRWAILGISSEMWMPGTAVGIDRNGPPVGVPGLGSHVSSWLEPPASQSRMTRLSLPLELASEHGALEHVEHRHVGGESRGAGGDRAEEATPAEGMVG